MKRIFPVIVTLFFLSACATTAGYEEILNSWMGETEKNLIQQWGVPNSVYESDDLKYLTYVKSSSGYMPGIPPTYQTQIIGNTVYTRPIGGSRGYSYHYHCTTTFTIQNRIIIQARWEGNSCKAYPQKSIVESLADKDENRDNTPDQ